MVISMSKLVRLPSNHTTVEISKICTVCDLAFLLIFHGKLPGNFDILHLKSMVYSEYMLSMVIYKMKPYLNWSVGASYNGNSFKTPCQGRFTYVLSFLSNWRPSFG